MKAFSTLLASMISFNSATTTTTLPNNEKHKASNECVILVHGLARTKRSMNTIEAALKQQGYHTINVDYPSRKYSIEKLAKQHLKPAVNHCQKKGVTQIHFVTHSMGGIVVRQLLAENRLPQLGNVVMLSPPNQGSELVDKLKEVPGFDFVNGPAGYQLSATKEGLPNRLGPVDYPVGVITGNKSINLILSTLIPNEDDGKVAVERAKVDGMRDFLVVPHSHPMILHSDQVIKQTIHFLQTAQFDHKENE